MTKTTRFVWDSVSDSVISELDETNTVTATYTNEPQHYGGVLSQRRSSFTSTLHADALGTTRLLTDNTQTVTDTDLFDAWGNPVASTGITINPLKWAGHYGYYTDNSTGNVYVRARTYQPIVALWASIDPLGPVGPRDPYTYSNRSPIATVDSSGLAPVDDPEVLIEKAMALCDRVYGGRPLELGICKRMAIGANGKLKLGEFSPFDLNQFLKGLWPDNACGKFKKEKEYPALFTPYGKLSPKLGIEGSVIACESEDGAPGFLLTWALIAKGETCVGVSVKPFEGTLIDKWNPEACCKTGLPKCVDTTVVGELAIYVEGKAGAVLGVKGKLKTKLFPFDPIPTGEVTFAANKFVGAQICGGLEGSLKGQKAIL